MRTRCIASSAHSHRAILAGTRLAPALLLVGCTAPTDPRAAWLVDELRRDNLAWLSRDVAPLVSKFDAMALDPYDFLRGTAGIWLRDLERPDGDRVLTALADDPESLDVLLVGDPHPENLGTLTRFEAPTAPPIEVDALAVEWVDVDGAVFGPAVLDLRRAALGLAVAVDGLCDDVCLAAATGAVGAGWLARLSEAEPVPPPRIVGDVVSDALGDGRERKRLRRWTRDGAFLLDEERTADGAGLLPLLGEEIEVARRVIDAYAGDPAAPEGFRVLDVCRRYGAGVASRPAIRLLVLWDRGAEGEGDDDLLQIREVIDPPTPSGLQRSMPGRFLDDADRIVSASRLLWTASDAEPRLAGVRADGDIAWKATNASSYAKEIDHLDVRLGLVEGDYEADDVIALGRFLGERLADAHAATWDGGAPPDTAALDVADLALADLETLRTDHALFVALREELGPLVGIDVADDGVAR
jgi:uncharacterized protein (DUF2252 family)